MLPSKRVLDKICTAYQIQPGELLKWEPDNISSL
ncbi:helix-turn-helix domain-containing protein [Microcoleus sp. Pol17_C1]